MTTQYSEFIKYRSKQTKLIRIYRNLPFWKKWFTKEPKKCDCTSSMMDSSWASDTLDIVFHVCEIHAKQFGIRSGPYWSGTARAMIKVEENERRKK